LLIHQKLTGHLLVGKWKIRDGRWTASSYPLSEKINSYVHLLFTLDNGEMLALSDLRKFAKVELWDTQELARSKEIKSLGPEPLAKEFTFSKFKEALGRRKGKVKQVLMNPEVIAGIGNIYSDEILFEAQVHPFKLIPDLTLEELKKIYRFTIQILKKAIELRGESMIDWRDPQGSKGFYDSYRKVYRREGEKCSRCRSNILRKKIGGRSAHFCPKCQKL
jgi:formamidopyrimidine-DNA glycosylase